MPHNKEENWQQDALLYAYGELPQERQEQFLAHIKQCKACQNIIRTTALLNAAMPQIKAPEELTIQAVSTRRVKAPFWKGILSGFNLRLLVPAGAMALMLVMAFGFYKTANIYLPRQTVQQDYIDNLYAGVYNLEDEIEDINDYIDNI